MDLIARFSPIFVLGAWVWAVSRAPFWINALFAVALMLSYAASEYDSIAVKRRQRAAGK